MTILTTIVILIASLFWTLALKLAIQGILLRAWLISHIFSYYRIYRKNRSSKVAWRSPILSWPRIMFFESANARIYSVQSVIGDTPPNIHFYELVKGIWALPYADLVSPRPNQYHRQVPYSTALYWPKYQSFSSWQSSEFLVNYVWIFYHRQVV